MKLRLSTTFAAVVTAVALLAAGAQAATIGGDDSGGLGGSQISDGAVYWAQTNVFNYWYDSEDVMRGRLLRRELASAQVETLYETGPDDSLTSFNAVEGRVIVGVANRVDESSSVIEIKRDAAGVSTSVLAARAPGSIGPACKARVRPIGVNSLGEAMVEELRSDSTDGNCAYGRLKRTISTITAIAPDGTSRVLIERKSPWSTSDELNVLGRPRWGGGDWLALLSGDSPYSIAPISSGMLDLTTGRFVESQSIASQWTPVEFSRGGRALVNSDGDSTYMVGDPNFPDKLRFLPARKSIRWMHFCGDKILEVSRARGRRLKGGRGRSPGGKRWNIYIRNLDGVRERRLSQTLARGTDFDGCNGETALFHKHIRRGKMRQFGVSLAPPAA